MEVDRASVGAKIHSFVVVAEADAPADDVKLRLRRRGADPGVAVGSDPQVLVAERGIRSSRIRLRRDEEFVRVRESKAGSVIAHYERQMLRDIGAIENGVEVRVARDVKPPHRGDRADAHVSRITFDTYVDLPYGRIDCAAGLDTQARHSAPVVEHA